jgi:hypothetical protein
MKPTKIKKQDSDMKELTFWLVSINKSMNTMMINGIRSLEDGVLMSSMPSGTFMEEFSHNT